MNPFPKKRCQKGDAMLEALIGVVLMAVIGLGLAHTSARSINSQRYLNAQNLAVTEIRGQLQHQSDLCNSESIAVPIAGRTVDFVPACNSETVTLSYSINGLAPAPSIDVQTLSSLSSNNSDNSRELFGGDGTVVISLQ